MCLKIFLLMMCLTISLAGETFVLIHGTGGGAWSWFKIKSILELKGHTVIAIDLPSLGVDKTNIQDIQLQDHINAILAVLDRLSEPAVVVGHSYGGIIASVVSEVRPQKVKRAVFICALMLQDGESASSAGQRDPNSLASKNGVIIPDSNGVPLKFIIMPDTGPKAICQDCNKEDLNLLILLAQPHPVSTLMTPIHIGAGFASVEKVYISTLQDTVITPSFQRDMYSKFPDVKVYKIKASHLVIFSKPKRIVDILTYSTPKKCLN